MASPRHIPTAAAGSGNKENISENGTAPLDCPALHKEVTFSAKGKKKPTGFNLRKSIAWNPAFFTEEGVLDNSELSMLTGPKLMAKGSPSSGVGMSPLCRSRKYDNTYALKQVAGKSPGKVPSNTSRAENQGRRLFSSAKTPQRDERKEPEEMQNRNSARSFQKRIPRAPAGSTQKKVPTSASTTLISRIPKKPLSSLPMALRSTTHATTVSKSNKKLAPVKTEHIHRVPGLVPKSKIDSGPSMETDVVPVAAAAIHKETSGSVKFENPQTSPTSFCGTTSTIAKPSALRRPSPSVGFFNQENAQMSHGDTAARNAGRFSAGSTPSLVKPPRYKLPEDLKAGIHLSKVLSTNVTPASNLVSLHVTTDSNTNTLVTSEKRSLSKIISTYSAKSRDANCQEIPEVYCSLAGSGDTTQSLISEKNDGARNSVSIVYKNTSRVEGRGIIKEIEPAENSLSFQATCFSTIKSTEDSCSPKVTCSSTKPSVGTKSSPSCISSQSNDLICQGTADSGLIAAIDFENSYVGEREPAVSLSQGESCTLDIHSFRNSDPSDNHNTERATSMESMEYTLYADQMPPSSSSSDRKPALDERNSVLNKSLHDEGKFALSAEPNTDVGTELETHRASSVTEDPFLHMECERNHSFKRTTCSPVKPESLMTYVERQNVLSVELNMEDKMEFDNNKLLSQEAASHTEEEKAVDRPRKNTILRDHLKNLVPFTEEWLAVMEACGQEVLEQKNGAVQNSPPDKTAPEPSPWSPVKRKAQDVGPFDCTKYSKSFRTSVTP